jgi:hemin uptake protein HemP
VIGGPIVNDRDVPEGPTGGRHVTSTALFRGEREIVIVHRGEEYRLRITKSDKLILTK